jgi:hypothetical protein
MEFAERESEDVVFITGEEKPDWWEVNDDHNIVRPRHELLREFRRESGQFFWMLTTENMLENAYELLGVEVRDKSVEQTDKVSQKGITSKTVLRRGDEEKQVGTVRKTPLVVIAENIEEKAEELSDIKTLGAGGAVKGAQATLSIVGDEITNEVEKALTLSDNLGSPNTENTIKEHLRQLAHATARGNEEAIVSYAADLAEYLRNVAETLRQEAQA